MFWNTLFVPSQIGHVNQKNKWDQYARVFIQVKVWLKRSLDQLEGGGMGRGHVKYRDKLWRARPQVKACSKTNMSGRNSPVSERGRGAMGW